MKSIKKTITYSSLFILVACILMLGLSFDRLYCKPAGLDNNSTFSQKCNDDLDYATKPEAYASKRSSKNFNHHQSDKVLTSQLNTKNIALQTLNMQCCSEQNNSVCLCLCSPSRSNNDGQNNNKNMFFSFFRISLLCSELVTPFINAYSKNKLSILNSFFPPLKTIPIYLQILSLLI